MRKLRYILAVAGMVSILGSVPFTTVQAAGTEVAVNEDTLYIKNSFSDEEIPEGFSKATMQYNGAGVSVLKSDTQDITLIYLTDADGENGAFYRFMSEGENASFSKYIQINMVDKRLIILEQSEGYIPDGYSETVLDVNGQNVKAWQQSGAEYVYLVYGVNELQEEDFYLYDASNGTYIRFEESGSGSVGEGSADEVELLQSRLTVMQTNYENNQDMLFKVMCGLMALSGVLFLIIVGLSFKIQGLKKGTRAKSSELKEDAEQKHKEAMINGYNMEEQLSGKKKRKKKKAKKEEFDEFEDFEDDDVDEITEDLIVSQLENMETETESLKGESDTIRNFHEIKLDLEEGQTEQEEETEELPDEGTEELEEISAKEEIMENISARMKEIDKEELEDEIEDYDDFELEILDLDDE